MNKQNHDQIISRKKEKTGWLRSAGESLLDLLYPGRCPVCERILLRNEPMICEKCARELPWVREPFCRKCGGCALTVRAVCITSMKAGLPFSMKKGCVGLSTA